MSDRMAKWDCGDINPRYRSRVGACRRTHPTFAGVTSNSLTGRMSVVVMLTLHCLQESAIGTRGLPCQACHSHQAVLGIHAQFCLFDDYQCKALRCISMTHVIIYCIYVQFCRSSYGQLAWSNCCCCSDLLFNEMSSSHMHRKVVLIADEKVSCLLMTKLIVMIIMTYRQIVLNVESWARKNMRVRQIWSI
jgi:hypothetical protein